VKNLENRFWAKVAVVGNVCECWLWIASKSTGGYGSFRAALSKSQGAHRFAYELMRGPIPAGLQLDHLCRVRHCVNPYHLEAVTCGENVRRGEAASKAKAWHAAITHCTKGHEYTVENTKFAPNGTRYCRECNRLRGLLLRRMNRDGRQAH
jgi:hypothetical protein